MMTVTPAENKDLLIIAKQFEALKAFGDTRNFFGMGSVNTPCRSISDPDIRLDCDNFNSNGCDMKSNTAKRSCLGTNRTVDDEPTNGKNNQTSDNDNNSNSDINSDINSKGNGNGNCNGFIDNIKELAFFRTNNYQPSRPFNFESMIINQEMLKYSSTERNAFYEEIHGVRSLCPDESTPGMVEDALDQLEIELRLLPIKEKKAYEESLTLPQSYVHTNAFRMRFLRAELFDARKAAFRMTLFLDALLDLYGPYALERPIMLSDFSKNEMRMLNAGRIQVLPFRDRCGRTVVVALPIHIVTMDARAKAKIHIYLWWVASESVETQRKGIVMIVIHNPAFSDQTTAASDSNHNEFTGGENNNNNNNNDIDRSHHIDENSNIDTEEPYQQQDVAGLPSLQFAKIYINRRKGMPIRMVAFHICTPDTPFYSILRSFNVAMLGDERCRVKVHVGQDIENRYQLNGFGIPLGQLPITESGKIKTTYFKKWLQLRKNLEDPNSKLRRDNAQIVESPGLNDVVFRPSQSTMCHPGNVMFRGLVESKHFEHSIAPSREAKIEITNGVINDVKNLGGRFLVWNNTTWWTELTDEKQIYSKIAVFFRNSKVSAKSKSNRLSANSGTYIFTGVRSESDNYNGKRRKIKNYFDCHTDDCNSRSSGEPCFSIT